MDQPNTPARDRRWDARLLTPVVVLLMCGLATGALVDGVLERGDLSVYDQPMLTWVVEHRTPVLTTVMTSVSLIGGEVVTSVLAAFVVLLLAWRRRRTEAVEFGVALAIAEGASLLVKHVLGRGRPPSLTVIGPWEQTMSFPSGHTIGTATFALMLSYLWWRGRPGWPRAVVGLVCSAAATVLMAASRLYLGDHWLTDVLASMSMAGAVVAVVVLGDQWWARRSTDPRRSALPG